MSSYTTITGWGLSHKLRIARFFVQHTGLCHNTDLDNHELEAEGAAGSWDATSATLDPKPSDRLVARLSSQQGLHEEIGHLRDRGRSLGQSVKFGFRV